MEDRDAILLLRAVEATNGGNKFRIVIEIGSDSSGVFAVLGDDDDRREFIEEEERRRLLFRSCFILAL